MNLRSISWSERIGRVRWPESCSAVRWPMPNRRRRAGCGNGPGDHCVANPNTYGFYETRWRRWPEVAAALEPVPAKAPSKNPHRSLRRRKSPATGWTRDFPKSRTRPPVDVNPPDPPRSPQMDLQDLDQDLPPRPNLPPAMPDEQLSAPEPITPIERPAAPPRESPVEPPPAEPTPPQRTEPAAAPPTPPRDDLPQPSMDDDLRRFLHEPKAPTKDDSATPKQKDDGATTKQPEANPPTKDTIKENPFRDDPLLPGEDPPPKPRPSRRPAPSPPRDTDTSAVEKNNLQFGFDKLDQVRVAAPAAMFRENRRANYRPVSPRPGRRSKSPTRPPAIGKFKPAHREANGPPPKGADPLRASPAKLLGIDTSFADQVQPTSEMPVAGRPIANPLR